METHIISHIEMSFIHPVIVCASSFTPGAQPLTIQMDQVFVPRVIDHLYSIHPYVNIRTVLHRGE